MDNQNAKKNGLVGIAGDIFRGEAPITTEADIKRATDSTGGPNAEDVVIRPQNYENVQTQSVVETAREQAEKELQQIKAYNDEMLRRQKLEEAKGKAKRSAARTFIVIFVIGIIVALVFLLINVLMNIYNPPDPTPPPKPDDPIRRDVVEGYKCNSSNCYKVVDMPDGRIFMRDDEYYIFDPTTSEATLTTVTKQEYYSVNAFVWGNDILIDLDDETGFNGIYSVNGNVMVTGFSYDEFYRDINDERYDEMRWAEGQYIIARKDGVLRLLRLRDGKDLIRGKKRVFINDKFLIAYNEDGERRIYTLDGKQIVVAVANSRIYIKNGTVLYVAIEDDGDVDFIMYDSNGEEVDEDDYSELERIEDIDEEVFVATMDRDTSYYRVPENN